ncbi:DUF6801 domain-containing protein [Streptomyces boninensis]|uniref:DUF6801 domain-containing protein n=1 Tax=Streptomyces boninensis TaxID=2039455 RepID=UPI003B22268D
MSRRHGLRLAGVGCLALVAGLLSGSGSAVGEQSARVAAEYECAVLGGGTQAISVDLAQGYPESGTAGKAIQPGELTVRVTVPATGVAKLLPEDAATVGGTAALTATVTQGSERAEAGWSGLAAKSDEVRVPAEGELELAFAGKVAPVTVGSGGDVTFTAGRLELTLKSAPPEGAAKSTQLTCGPADGARTKLATVPVEEAEDGGGGSSDTPSGSAGPEVDGSSGGSIDTGVQPLASAGKCPTTPPKGKLNKEFLPKPPPGADVGEEGEGTPMCAVPAGFATMRKQNQSAIVNDPRGRGRTGLMQLAFQKRTVTAEGYNEFDSLGIMKLADSRSTFLTFGFQPTTASVRFEPEPATVVAITGGGRKPRVTVGYYQHLRLHNVTLNGAPLDVGSRCRTSKKIRTVLTGSYIVGSGGTLEGSIDIPKFSGCGAGGEDLDPLINASIAGPDNPLKIEQGNACGGGSTTCEVPRLPKL